MQGDSDWSKGGGEPAGLCFEVLETDEDHGTSAPALATPRHHQFNSTPEFEPQKYLYALVVITRENPWREPGRDRGRRR